MSSLMEKDCQERTQLRALMTRACKKLDELISRDEQLTKQLETEFITRTWREHSSTLLNLLEESAGPIIVAGTETFCMRN